MKKLFNLMCITITILLLLFAGSCKQPSSGGSSDNVKSQENLKDVLDAGEDLSGTWELTDAYLLLYNSEHGKPSPDNFESSDIDEILNQPDDHGNKPEIPKVVTLKSKEEADTVLRELINEFEENARERKEEFEETEQGLALAQLFGLRITKNNKKSDSYIKINKDRTVITFYDYIEVELAMSGTMMGEKVDEELKGKGKLRIVYTKKQ